MRIFRVSLAALALSMCVALDAASLRLVREWQVHLGVPQRQEFYRAAVCPDGSFWLANGLGQAAVIDRRGNLLPMRNGLSGFFTVSALACGPDGLIYTAARDALYVYRGGGVVSRADAAVSIRRMAIGGDGLIYAAGWPRGNPRSQPLHVLTREGKLLRSFGNPPSPFVMPVRPEEGFPVWDEAGRRLLFLPELHYEIQVYDPDGRLLKVWGPDDQEPVHPAAAGRRMVIDVLGAARLPDGALAVELRGSTGRTGDPNTFLDLYSSGLRVQQLSIPVAAGVLIGASADGGLYFLQVNAQGMLVTRLRLQ